MIAGLLVGSALAQQVRTEPYPIDAERFRPVIDPYGYVVAESASTLQHLQLGVGVWGSYEDDSVVLLADGERVRGPAPDPGDGLLDTKTVMDFQLGFGLGDVFSFVADAPLVVSQTGFEPAAADSPVPTASLVPSGAGDLRLTPKVVLLDVTETRPIGVAVLATGTVPLGSSRSFLGEGEVTVAPLVAVEAANGGIRTGGYQIRGALNAGVRIKRPDRFRAQAFGTELLVRAAVAARPVSAIEVGADLAGEVAGRAVAQTPLEVLPWLRLHAGDTLALTAGGGVGLLAGLGAPDYRLFAGATLAPRFDPQTVDRDGDTIPNRYDLCIQVAEDVDGFEDDDGCGDPDNDRDGISDAQDTCPNDLEDFDSVADADGCPDPDNDQDGVHDTTDRCVDLPEDADRFQDLDGCPEPDNDTDGLSDGDDRCPMVAETPNGLVGCPENWVDLDQDGVSDPMDRCPSEPEDVDSTADDDGCPDDDNDQDGVLDPMDRCPAEPETQNGHRDDDGCPDAAPERVIVQQEKIVITEPVSFAYGTAIVGATSYELLREVARVIAAHPRITLVQVEGHTDNGGSNGYNQKLSQARAEAVADVLVDAGVDPKRLVAKGFGEGLPIESNDSVVGKAKNRRVEFTILEQQ